MLIDKNTRIYAIAGDPIENSRSPKLFNTLFQRYGWNGVYLFLEKSDPREIKILLRTIPIEGLSVTMPHKREAIFFVDEINFSAQKVGAVNTITRKKDGTLLGSNEDYEAFLELVEERIPPEQQKKVLICGRGATAKTSAEALLELGHVKEIKFLVRTIEKKITSPQEVKVSWYSQEEYRDVDHEEIGLIINATSVGMNKEEKFFLRKEFIKGRAVIDWVYAPMGNTQLIESVQEDDRKNFIEGQELFIRQAIRQFRRFTQKEVSYEEIKEILSRE